jgi:two-component system phosphate regulon sensor histidine kinase PhoR
MAISSLIDNAIKFTDKGSVNVILHKDKNDDLILDVKDTGIGIDKEYLDHIGRKKWGTEKPMMELGLVSQ